MFLKKPHQGKLQEWTIEEIVAAFKKTGEQKYFNALFDRYLHLVLYTCRKFLSDREELRDMVMQVFAKVYQLLQQQEVYSFSNWLYTLIKNECITFLRHQNRLTPEIEYLEDAQEIIHESEPEPGYAVNGTPLEYLVQQAVDQLDEGQRTCIQLFYFEKKSYKEIAGLTRFSENQVKSYLQNGKRRLRQLLEPIIQGEDKLQQ